MTRKQECAGVRKAELVRGDSSDLARMLERVTRLYAEAGMALKALSVDIECLRQHAGRLREKRSCTCYVKNGKCVCGTNKH